MSTDRDQLDLTELFLRIWKWKWPIVISSISAMVLAFVFTRFIPPEYQSYTILYPSATTSKEKFLEEFTFGYDIHAERVVQLMESTFIRDSIVKKFNLEDRYEIDKTRKGWEDNVTREYFRRVQPSKTRYKSVSLVVTDHDPDTAAMIANEVARLVNVVNANIIKETSLAQLDEIEKAYKEKNAEVEALYDSLARARARVTDKATGKVGTELASRTRRLKSLRDSLQHLTETYRISDFDAYMNSLNNELRAAQAQFQEESGNLEVFSKTLSETDSLVVITRARVEGAKRKREFFKTEIEKIAPVALKYNKWHEELTRDGVGENLLQQEFTRLSTSMNSSFEDVTVSRIQEDLEWDVLQLNELKTKYQRALDNSLDPLPIAYQISEARPSYLKTAPKTKVIMLVAGFFAAFVSYVVLLIRTRLRSLKGGA